MIRQFCLLAFVLKPTLSPGTDKFPHQSDCDLSQCAFNFKTHYQKFKSGNHNSIATLQFATLTISLQIKYVD